jgi:hypothetical protein
MYLYVHVTQYGNIYTKIIEEKDLGRIEAGETFKLVYCLDAFF